MCIQETSLGALVGLFGQGTVGSWVPGRCSRKGVKISGERLFLGQQLHNPMGKSALGGGLEGGVLKCRTWGKGPSCLV